MVAPLLSHLLPSYIVSAWLFRPRSKPRPDQESRECVYSAWELDWANLCPRLKDYLTLGRLAIMHFRGELYSIFLTPRASRNSGMFALFNRREGNFG